MPAKAPQYSAIWAVQLIDLLEEQGVEMAPLLARAKIDPAVLSAAEPTMPFASLTALFELAAEVTGDDLLPFRFGQDRDIRDAGVLAYVGLAAPRLEDALRNYARYVRVFGEATEIDLSDLASDGRFRLIHHVPISIERQRYTEFICAVLTKAVRELTGTPLRLRGASFGHPRTRHREAFDAYFGGPTRFDARETVLHFARSDLDRPLPSSDDRLARILRAHCEDVLARRGSQRPGLVEQVERAIIRHSGGDGPRAARVAADLGMSQRTLARRLAELGTSFSQVVDVLRRALAERYLHQSDMSLSEIAFLLGYSDLSAFTTAFRRWTGKTPGAVRRAGRG